MLPSVGILAGADFAPEQLRAEVADFYEQTSSWELAVRSQWSVLARPFGWLLTRLFSRRLDQLSLPMRGDDVAQGIESQVLSSTDATGRHLGSAWLRTLRHSGTTVYSGWYSVVTLPNRDQPSLRVVFPLPNGNLTVLLRPEVTPEGALRLVSPIAGFGDDGAYLLVREGEGGRAWVRRVPIAEEFLVYVDGNGSLRTDHNLRLCGFHVVRLHYEITKRA